MFFEKPYLTPWACHKADRVPPPPLRAYTQLQEYCAPVTSHQDQEWHVSDEYADVLQELVAEKLETGLQSALNPKFSPDGKHMYFLGHQAAVSSGAHGASMTLERISWPAKSKP